MKSIEVPRLTFCASRPVNLLCLSCSFRIMNGLPYSSKVIPCGRACRGIAVIFDDIWKEGSLNLLPITLDFSEWFSKENVRALLEPVEPRPPSRSRCSRTTANARSQATLIINYLEQGPGCTRLVGSTKCAIEREGLYYIVRQLVAYKITKEISPKIPFLGLPLLPSTQPHGTACYVDYALD